MVKDVRDRSIDPASQEMLDVCQRAGLETAWDRYEKQQPQCGFGELGLCCRNCNMGPCRIDPFGEGASKGVCGATADIIVARNFLRSIAAGAAAHSDHARDVAHTFRAVAMGKAPSYSIKDQAKLERLMKEYGVETQIALADAIMAEFGKQDGPIQFTRRAPAKRLELWKKLGIEPRGIDREIVECMHRTHMGVDNDYVSLILQGLRTGLADGWGGSMIATELQDVLFGTPTPTFSEANLGVLEPNQVNVIVHGHEPLLSEMIVAAAADPEIGGAGQKAGRSGHQRGRNVLHGKRGSHAPRRAGSRKLPAARAGRGHRSRGCHDCGCAVRHACAGSARWLLPHQVHLHLSQGQVPRRGAHGVS